MSDDEDFATRAWEAAQEWSESAIQCPECGAPGLVRPWWDDHPNDGGACIGELRKCSSETCDYYEQF